MCNTNLTREQLISILSDAQQLVQNARSALTLDVAYKGTKEPALFEFYEDECKAVHKRVDAILEAAGVEFKRHHVRTAGRIPQALAKTVLQ